MINGYNKKTSKKLKQSNNTDHHAHSHLVHVREYPVLAALPRSLPNKILRLAGDLFEKRALGALPQNPVTRRRGAATTAATAVLSSNRGGYRGRTLLATLTTRLGAYGVTRTRGTREARGSGQHVSHRWLTLEYRWVDRGYLIVALF